MKNVLIVFFFSSISYNAFSQFLILNDSLKIDFLDNEGQLKIVGSQSDLNYKIVVKNMSTKVRRSYTELIYDEASSPFANYYWELYEKIDSSYSPIPRQTHSSGAGYIYDELFRKYGDRLKADSAFAVFDIQKKDLLPLESDTLQFNFLLDKQYLDPGDYGVRVFFRANDFYAIHNNMRTSLGRNYVSSDLYYFRVLKRLSASFNVPAKN